MLIAGREDPTLDPSTLREPNRSPRRAPGAPPARQAGSRVLLPCLVLALVTSGCPFEDTDTQAPPLPLPETSDLEVVVVPSEIVVPSNWAGKFSVQVLARDPDGNVYYQLPALDPNGDVVFRDLDVTWSPAVEGVSPSGWLTQVEVLPSNESVITLEASIVGVPEPGTLTLRRTDVPGDEVRAAHTAGDLAEVLLAAGAGSSGECVDAAYGFVGKTAMPRALTGELCRNEAALFSSRGAAARRALAQSAGGANTGNQGGNTIDQWNVPLALPNEIKLTAYVLCQPSAPCTSDQPDPDLVELMREQVDFAKASFAQSRVGVTVSYVPLTNREDLSDAKGCNTAAKALKKDPNRFPLGGQVVVVLIRGGGAIGFLGSMTAEMCGPAHLIPELDAGKGLIVMDPNTTRDPSVLAHELGHVLGLKEPDGGHVAQLYGIGDDNIMAEAIDFIPRFRFTLGQVYRMNFATNGLLTANGLQPSVACGCDPQAASPCPPPVRDLKPLESADIRWGGRCP